jgi:hypothetical protein
MKDPPWDGPDSTGASLLEAIKHLPQWAGDDAEACLDIVIRSRSRVDFTRAPREPATQEGVMMAVTAQRRDRRADAANDNPQPDEKSQNPTDAPTPSHLRQSTVGDLLKFAGTWEGDDLEECLEAVYASRSQVTA